VDDDLGSHRAQPGYRNRGAVSPHLPGPPLPKGEEGEGIPGSAGIPAGLDPHLVLDRLRKSFGAQTVLQNLSLAVEKGEILALLGPSGSGKTTALRLIAGFETPDSGRIVVAGEDLTPLPPERRKFGMVFQHYALFPHLTVGENVAFGLAGRSGKEETARRVSAALALVDLPGFEGRRVGEISGGQQQRVALARALAPEPRVLLLDEPLSNLDPTLRERTRRELKRAIQRVGITTVLVTHEQEEAFDLGDRVAVLQGGVLHQVGTPEDLYERPETRFVATFVGRASVLSRPAARALGLETADIGEGGEEVDFVVRPESLTFRPPDNAQSLAGKVTARRYAGPVTYYQVALDSGGEVEVLAPSGAASPGDEVRVARDPRGPEPRVFRRHVLHNLDIAHSVEEPS
jgi:ABC-type Fe3+/spermidine/putrescine transport system ATPase subunit